MMKKFGIPLWIALTWMILLQAASGAEQGQEAPAFSLPMLQSSGEATLDDYSGKIIYVDFWASWCPPCLVSMPIMNEMRNRLQEQGVPFEVLAIDVDSDPEDGIDFLLDKPVDFVVLSDPEGRTPADYKVVGMPTSFLIEADGTIAMRHQGFKRSDGEMIEKAILELAEAMQ